MRSTKTKPVKRLAALLLSLLLAILCLAPASAALPAGVTADQVNVLMPKLDKVITGTLAKEGKSISDQLYGAIMSDDAMNELFLSVYKALSEQVSTMNAIGVDVSVQSVKANLYNYPEVQAALGENTDWAAVLAAPFTPHWNLREKNDIKLALGAILSPLNELLHTLLCGGNYVISPFVVVQGANGYENVIVPLLKTIGVTGIMTQTDFTARSNENRANMLADVLDMAFSALDAVAAAPVTELTKRLPAIAHYLENDGLKNAVTTLLEPMKVRVGIFSLTGVDKLLNNLDLFSDSADLTTILQNLDVGAALGSDVKLTLPEIKLSELAACGSGQIGSYASNPTECFTVLFRWLVDAVKQNKAQLPQLLGGSVPSSILDSFLAKSADELLKLLIDLTNLNPADTVLDYAWTAPAYTPGTVPYTANLNEQNFSKMLAEIDGTLSDAMVDLANSQPLSTMLAEKIYSSELVTTLMKTVYDALYSEQTVPVMEILGVAVTPAGVADAVAGSYPTVAAALRRYTRWESVPTDGFFWLQDGNQQGFVNAVTAILKPLRPMLTFLLAEGSITLLDAVNVPGSNGYNTAVIPILEALGCGADRIKSYAEYKATAGTDKALTDILDPIASLIERVVQAPVATVTEILPNLVFFLQSGQMKQCVENLLYPVKVLLKKLDLEGLLPAELTEMGDIDPAALLGTLTDNADLSLKLAPPNLDLLASLGTQEERPSKRTTGGQAVNFTYIRANREQVLMDILRYVIGSLKSEENANVLSGLMQQEDDTGGGDMFATYTVKITEQLKTMSVDETIEWLYDLLFSETPKREKPVDEDVPAFEYVEQEKPSEAPKVILIVVGVVLALGLIVLLSRVNFHDRRERKKALKKKRKAQKESMKQAVARSKGKAPAAPGKPGQPNAPAADPNAQKDPNAQPQTVLPVDPNVLASAADDAANGEAPPKEVLLVDPLSSMRRKRTDASPAPAKRTKTETPEQRAARIGAENALIKKKLKAQKAQKKLERRHFANPETGVPAEAYVDPLNEGGEKEN